MACDSVAKRMAHDGAGSDLVGEHEGPGFEDHVTTSRRARRGLLLGWRGRGSTVERDNSESELKKTPEDASK